MYTIRDVTVADATSILALCSTLAQKHYPELRFDRARAKAALLSLLCDRDKHYLRMTADLTGSCAGLLLASSADNLWAERKHCGILLWHAVKPGGGIPLLRDFKQWVRTRRFIRIAGLQMDCEVDQRVCLILERLGFQPKGVSASLFFN